MYLLYTNKFDIHNKYNIDIYSVLSDKILKN